MVANFLYLSYLTVVVFSVWVPWRELPEPVADHVLADEDRHMLAPVVDRDRVPDHVGVDHRRARPGADHLLVARLVHLLDLGPQRRADERTFLRRT